MMHRIYAVAVSLTEFLCVDILVSMYSSSGTFSWLDGLECIYSCTYVIDVGKKLYNHWFRS